MITRFLVVGKSRILAGTGGTQSGYSILYMCYSLIQTSHIQMVTVDEVDDAVCKPQSSN